jgi:glycosyltransferase involved in cell wall biosynthesis
MKLSIIIPAKNEEHYIKKALQSVKNQFQKGDEVIVVCSSCTDQTEQVAKRYTKKVYNHKGNVSEARNYGAKKAKNNILIFLDADSTISNNLLKEIRKTIESGAIGGTCKTQTLEPSWKADIIWAIGNFGRNFFLAASGLFFCTKETFNKVKGYDEKLTIAEDTYLILALKKHGKLKYIRNAHIKTSARRMEKEGYLKTIYIQFKGFFIKSFNQY